MHENEIYLSPDKTGDSDEDSFYNPNSDIDSNDEGNPNNDYPDTPNESDEYQNSSDEDSDDSFEARPKRSKKDDFLYPIYVDDDEY